MDTQQTQAFPSSAQPPTIPLDELKLQHEQELQLKEQIRSENSATVSTATNEKSREKEGDGNIEDSKQAIS